MRDSIESGRYVTCRHCMTSFLDEHRLFVFCPYCRGLLKKPRRRVFKPLDFFDRFGTKAFALEDLSRDDWIVLGEAGTAIFEWVEQYLEDHEECSRMDALVKFAFDHNPLGEWEWKRKYICNEVIADVSKGICYYHRRGDIDEDYDSSINDIKMYGWIKNDPKKELYELTIPKEVWSEIGRIVPQGTVPSDSLIVLSTSDYSGCFMGCESHAVRDGECGVLGNFLYYEKKLNIEEVKSIRFPGKACKEKTVIFPVESIGDQVNLDRV